ncbi:MAG: T9SS type A sorting domain-containing protein [Ignavibacteria bacterium]|jgi:hypothetical protein
MLPKKYVSLMILTTIFISSFLFAQENVLRLLPASESTLSVMEQIMADTAANGGVIPEGRVYELDGGAIYLNTAYMYIEETFDLHMRSSNDQKAIIYQYPTNTGDNPQNPPGYFCRTRGGDVTLENIALVGYYEPDDDPDNGVFDQLYTVQGNMIRTDGEGANITFKGCVFSNINGQVLRTNSSTQTVRIEDCVLANLGALSTSNFGAGKGIDLRESSCDSLILINNTFVNYQDRAVRHYNYSDPAAGTGNIEYGLIDHNTFVNGMGFHGLLSLGNVGAEMTITNNLFVDAFAAGEDSTDATRTAEWANTGEQYGNGNNRIAWIFAAPTGETDWTVNNNYYAVTADGQSFFDAHAEIGVGEPLSNYIKGELGDGAATAFTMIDDPSLSNAPDLMLGMMDYYVNVAGKLKDTPNDYWDPATQDMDRRVISYYINDFDVSYSTSSTAYTGAEDGFPAGDLNWFPDRKDDWITDVEDIDGENALPTEYTLSQNYPNPFNPSTVIEFSNPKSSIVQITIYNVLGQKVRTLVNEFINAGHHKVDWNGRDDYGKQLSSGVYLDRLNSRDFQVTKKMMLLK